MSAARRLAVSLSALLVAVSVVASGQPLPSGEAPEPAPSPPTAAGDQPIVVPAELASPRATMRSFLEAFDASKRPEGVSALELAARCLDLSRLPPDLRDSRGRELAAELKLILDRTELIDIGSMPDRATGGPWSLPVSDDGAVVIDRDEAGRWLFSAETVDALPVLVRATEGREVVEGVVRAERLPFSLWLRAQMPAPLLQVGFVLEHWQWLGILVLAALGVLVDRLVTSGLLRALERRLGPRLGAARSRELGPLLRPTGLLAAALVWWVGVFWFALPPDVLQVLLVAARFVAIAAFVWSAYRLVDVLAAVLEERAATTENKYDDLLVPLVRKSAKIFIAAFGLVFIADNLDVEVSSLLAGLGIGGIALALAAQDTVRNLFGSLTVIVDQPFHVGDWVVIEGIEGTIAEVGFRSTRIRTFYDSLVTLPNARLISAAVDNYGARTHRRWKAMLGLTYDTPGHKVDAFCDGLRQLIESQPHTRKDSFHVALNGFGPSSLDILLYVFFTTPDWASELRERHRLALGILQLAKDVGVEFAFPTQTIHLQRDPGEPALHDPATRPSGGG